MKLKRRRETEMPPKIRSFIRSVTAAPLEGIEELLKGFTWEFDKGDFHHWVDLFSHFEAFFEKYIKPRKDLHVEDNFLEADPPFPREATLQVLRVIRIILENCKKQALYHLSSLLASTDADVVEASLMTLAAFSKKTNGRCSLLDSTLTSKLFSFSQGWGAKEECIGLIACSAEGGCDPVAHELGSTLHFQFYQMDDTSKETGNAEQQSRGLRIIHLPNISSYRDTDLELLNKLVTEYKVSPNLRFSLLTRLRFARAFDSLPARQQHVCIRLHAFIVFVQASGDTDDLASFFVNQPEFVNELVSLLSYEDAIPEKIRTLGILSLLALCQDQSRLSMVLNSLMCNGHLGILPNLLQKTMDSIVRDYSSQAIIFPETLISLVNGLVSSSSGRRAMQDFGFIPILLPLLKDTNPQHLHLVSNAVHILKALNVYTNPAAAGGLDDTIARLKFEVSYVDNGPKKHEEESHYKKKGKQGLNSSSELDVCPLYSEALVTYNRRSLMKALLSAISLGICTPGNSGRVYGSVENLLPHCLCTIFRRAKELGGGVFSLAAIVMSDLIHKYPTCFSVLEAADLPRAFLDAVMGGVLYSAKVVTQIPLCLEALCLNLTGLQAVKERNALGCFVKIFTTRTYLQSLSSDTLRSLSTNLDALMRHQSSLCGPGVDMLIEIFNTILKIGSEEEPYLSSIESSSSSAPIPMESDQEEGSLVSQDEGKSSRLESTEQPLEAPSDDFSINVESFLRECISNAAHLLEVVLQNAETCSLFIEKKGLEAVLQLFSLPLMPLWVSIGQNVSVAFKKFSPQHSVRLARVVCTFLREHLRLVNDLLESVSGIQLAKLEGAKQTKVLRSLSSLEGLLLLSNFLLKGTSMISELGSTDADVLNDLGRAYKAVLWQITLICYSKADEKWDAEQAVVIPGSTVANAAGRERCTDADILPFIRYMNPVSVRHVSAPHWSEVTEQEFLTVIGSGDGIHRHGRQGLSCTRDGRISQQLDSIIDLESSSNALEDSSVQNVKKKSPDVIVLQVLNKLAVAVRSLHNSLAKGLMGSHHRADSALASRSLAVALAKIFHEALSYSCHSTAGLEVKHYVKCRYLGKVVNDMASLVINKRGSSCNTVLMNSFYVHGTFKELLATFEATCQLLWTPSYSISNPDADQGKAIDGNKLSHSSWLVDTLRSYCLFLENFTCPSLILSRSSASHAEPLVHPFEPELSTELFPIPKDASLFFRMLQSQVFDVVLPVWNHPMFPHCHPAFITSMVFVVTHIYSCVDDVNPNHKAITRSTGQHLTGPPLDEGAIAMVMEMGFTRPRAEEAFRHVGSNSIESATNWLFCHPEECLDENEDITKAIALSLENSLEKAPPVDDILAASMRLFHCSDSIAYPLTDLLVTVCNCNKGENRQRVALYLIQQLKLCQSDFSQEIDKLFSVTYILALLLSEDCGTRDIAAENGIVYAALNTLSNLSVRMDIREQVPVSKCISALLLILDNMSQGEATVPSESNEVVCSGSTDNASARDSLRSTESDVDNKSPSDAQRKEFCNALEKILGKSTGHLSLEESHRTVAVACDLIKKHVPAVVMQAVLQLCARLTKTYTIAIQFLESGSLAALFSLPRSCLFPRFGILASAIINHILEDPRTLQTDMEWEIRQKMTGVFSCHGDRRQLRSFLKAMAPVIARDPEIFMRASAAVCQLESNEGRMHIVLSKEKEKDKCPTDHKRVPPNLTLVIDKFLEIIMNYPSPGKQEEFDSSSTLMEVDESSMKDKGKSKIDELKKANFKSPSAKSEDLAKVTFILKLMSDIILMYVHSMEVVLKRDSETHQLRILNQADGLGNGGILHHILHHLLLTSSDKTSDVTDEWKEKLSEKASWFLVVLCVCSGEGSRRVINEIVKALSCFSNLDNNSSKNVVLSNKRVLIFTELVNSILSKSASARNLPSARCSSDVAKSMIDGGMVQSLTNMLDLMDLDHPEAPEFVDLILKALVSLTRAANASEQLVKLDGPIKKKSSGTNERNGEQTNSVSDDEVPEDGQGVSNESGVVPSDDIDYDEEMGGNVQDDEDEDVAGGGADFISLADLDYHDGLVNDEEEDFHQNHVTEVRLAGGFTRFHQDFLHVLGRSGDANGLINIAAEPLQGVNVRGSLTFERQHHGRTSHDKSGLQGSAFQHPLLLRPSQSRDQNMSSSWNSSRDLEALSVKFDLAHIYMLDSPGRSENSVYVFGNRWVDASMSSYGRWTDDCQSSKAAAIAQAVEEQFIFQLRSMVPINNPSCDGHPENTVRNEMENLDAPTLICEFPAVVMNDLVIPPSDNQPQEGLRISSALEEESNCIKGDRTLNLSHGQLNVELAIGEAGEALRAHESVTSIDALVHSNMELPDAINAHAGSIHSGADVDRDSLDAVGNQSESNAINFPCGADGPPTVKNTEVSRDSLQVDDVNVNNETSSSSAIDPTFLEVLPGNLWAEVLASQLQQPVQVGTYSLPSAEDLDPVFLSALPPNIQEELLAQQQAQRISQSQQARGQPVGMHSASILDTSYPDLHEDVLSSEAFLSALPLPTLSEVQMVRESQRNDIAIGNQAVMDTGIGVSIDRRPFSVPENGLMVKEIKRISLLDPSSLKALLRLLRLAQLSAKGYLQKLLLNLCEHCGTRAILVSLLLDMIKLEAEGCAAGTVAHTSQRLYGCQSNVVYGRSQLLDGLPPLVSRRVLEVLTYLATEQLAFANILFDFDFSLVSESASASRPETNKINKGKIAEGTGLSGMLITSQKYHVPLKLFLKLLTRPLFLCSNAHLEQVMVLIQVVVNKAVSKIDFEPLTESLQNAGRIQAQSVNGEQLAAQKELSISEQNCDEKKESCSTEASSSGGKKNVNQYDIFLQLPNSELCNLCSILAHESLSEKVYSLAAELVKKMASVAASLRNFFISVLADLTHNLSASVVGKLVTLRSRRMLGLIADSMAGAAILRVLQALHTLTSAIDGIKKQESESEQANQTIVWKLNGALDPLWQELSECITMLENELGKNSTFSYPISGSNIRYVVGGASSLFPPLPPSTLQILPFIEAFFLLSEKLQANHYNPQIDNNVTAREVKEYDGSSSASSVKSGDLVQKRLDGTMTFIRFADKHRLLLNAFIRQNSGLLEKSFSIMLKAPNLIDFDNKRTYFRSRIRQQNEQNPSDSLQIIVRRAYVLEDSYRQLHVRSSQDLRGEWTVQFQGEEGYDAGGLTREWYQLLSRVAKALSDGQLLDVYFTRSFYKHILGLKVTYHDMKDVDHEYYKNLEWMLEVMDFELIPGGRNITVTEETKHEYINLVAEYVLTKSIHCQIHSFLEGFNELVPRDLISIFNEEELELLISGLPVIDLDDLQANTGYTGYTAASSVVQWFWEVVEAFNKEDRSRLLQFTTGTSKVPLEGFKALQGASGPQIFQIHKAYGSPERLPSANTCSNQLNLPDYTTKEQLEDRLLLAMHEGCEGFDFA
ncbi:E3 ubiquitin-protein ligase UPL1 [Acorus gramineus]|uniref:HECT-type E3 ubiquitin transferase n=1 Tax=Acorus gramineus TaxID=55184 RepID=A0AAV9AZL1_ACOGR|nr:E3 ubiquitin-protein ligase UPL1 [Acorus gramineus]